MINQVQEAFDPSHAIRAISDYTMSSLPPRPVKPPSGPGGKAALKTYLDDSVVYLTRQLDDLFARYYTAGIEYHSLPYAARRSKDLDAKARELLEDVFSRTQYGLISTRVDHPFNDMMSDITISISQLRLDPSEWDARCGAAWTVSNTYERAEELEELVDEIEAAVAEVVAIKDSLTERNLLPTPDPYADAALKCFEEWGRELIEWSRFERDWWVHFST